ncbi:MAG: Ig-like domain-containing protein [Planctomycetota bacterium]
MVETGLVRGYLTVPGQHSGFADLHLSSDALSLRGSLQNEQLTLRKDACGNRPPSVTLISPQEGQSFPSGTTITLIGEVSDEDISIPLERMFFSSHRDGPVGGSFIKGDKSMTLNTNSLSAGQHSISFIAIDSGGLTDSRTATITVTQQPPQPPEVAVP